MFTKIWEKPKATTSIKVKMYAMRNLASEFKDFVSVSVECNISTLFSIIALLS